MNPITLCLALILVLAGLATGEFVSVWLAPLFFIAAVLVSLSVKVANVWEKYVVLRVGKLQGVKGPGFFMIIPVIDNVVAVIDERIQTTAFNAEQALTKDTVPVNVDAIIFSSAARLASCTRQKMMASTLTGTVSLVRACSALKAVVWIRSSITATTVSTTGKIRNRPGPLTPISLPARSTTNFCQVLAILSEAATIAARMTKTGVRKYRPRDPAPPASSRHTKTRKRVIGFIGLS